MARHVLGDAAAARLREVLSQHAGPSAGPAVAAGGSGQMVRVTGPEQEDAPGWWPCVPSDYVTSEAVFDEADSEGDALAAGLVHAPNGPLAVDSYYLALPADDLAGGDASVPVWVTDAREPVEGVTISEADGDPSYEGVTSITVDQDSGLRLTQPDGEGTAHLSYEGGTVAEDTTFEGDVTVEGGLTVEGDVSLDGDTTITIPAGQTLNLSGGTVLINGLQLDTSRLAVAQTAHGLAVGDAVYFDGTDWLLADASDGAKLGLAIVCKVSSADALTVQFSGVISGMPNDFTGGQYYFVSPVNPGDYVAVEPTAPDWSNPLYFARTGTTGVVLPWRPSRVAVGPPADVPDLDGTAGDAEILWEWDAIATSPAPDGFILQWSTSGSFSSLTGSTTTSGSAIDYTATGLTNGTTYYARIKSMHNGAGSDWSATANATPSAPAPTSPHVVTSSGTFLIPAADFTVQAIGGGGGGAGGDGAGSGGGGGGGGGWATRSVTGATIGATLSIAIGAGGAGVAGSGPGFGGSGGTTSVTLSGSPLVEAGGGSGGFAPSIASGAGGSGATSPLTGDSSNTGGSGGNGNDSASYQVGSGGGAGGPTGGGGTGGSGSAPQPGGGGNSPGGDGGTGDGTGGNGVSPGGGGGGSLDAVDGGDGADGMVIITW